MILTGEGGLLWACACIISIFSLQHRVAFWLNIPSTPIHCTRIQETAQLKKGTVITICPMTDRELMTSINKLKILHVRRTEEWAQSDWMASSVSLIPPQELRAQVLANGTDLRTHPLCCEGSAARLDEARLVLNRSDMTTEQKIHTCCQIQKTVLRATGCQSFQTCFGQPQMHFLKGHVGWLKKKKKRKKRK